MNILDTAAEPFVGLPRFVVRPWTALIALVLVVSGTFVSPTVSGAASPVCRTEASYRGLTALVSGVEPGEVLELFVDGVLADSTWANHGEESQTQLVAIAEDAEPHHFTVRIGEDATRILDCGTTVGVLPFPVGEWHCSIDGTIDGAPRIVRDLELWDALLVRDGEVVVPFEVPGALLDFSARPSTRHRYAMRFVGAQPTLEVPCGSITTPARTVAQRLATARYHEAIKLAPYVYVLQRPTCPGCDEPFGLYTTASEDNDIDPDEPLADDGGAEPPAEGCSPTDFSCFPNYRYDPPFEQQGTLPAGHPGLYPPRLLGGQLAKAIEAGRQVSITTDGRSAITSWSIDGFGGEIACTQFDTRPPELHDGTCDNYLDSFLVRDATNLPAILDSRDAPGATRGIFRLYHAYFGRAPDVAGARYWVDLHSRGLAPAAIADQFVASEESSLNWGAEGTTDFLDRIYENVLGRTPDPAGAEYWAGLIDAGMTRGEVIWWFAQSTEFRREYSYSPAYLTAHEDELVDR